MSAIKPTWLDESTTIRKSDHTDMPRASRIRFGGIPDSALSYDAVNEEVVVDLSAVISGGSGTGLLVNYVGIVNQGDVLTSAGDNTDPTKVVQGTTANIAAGGVVKGVAALPPASGKVLLALPGAALPTSVTGLNPAAGVGRVVANSSGRPVRKQPPAFADAIVGFQDSAGVLHVLPEKSRVGQLVFDVLDYDPLVGQVGHDASPGIEAAIADALDTQAVYFSETGRAHQATVLLPAGSVEPSRPARIKNFRDTAARRARGSNFKLLGRGHATVVRPSFMGPLIVVGQDQLQYPALAHNGPFSSGTSPTLDCHKHTYTEFVGTFDVQYTAQIRHNGCGAAEVNGSRSFSFEGWFKEDSGQTGRRIFASSFGTEGQTTGVFDTSWMFQMTDAFGGNKLAIQCTMTDGEHVLTPAADTAANVWHHAVVDFDGTTLRLGIDGTVVASVVPAAGASLVQKPWEGTSLGRGVAGLGGGDEQTTQFLGYLGPWRLTYSGGAGSSNYGASMASGGTYTVPTAAFPVGGAMSFLDIFVINWDEMSDDTFKFYSGQRVGYLALSMPSNFNIPIGELEIGDFDIYGNNGVTAGGIFCQNTTAHYFHDIDTTLVWFHSWSTAQSYDSLWERCFAQSSGYGGFIDADTGGNRYIACGSENAPIHFLCTAPNYYDSCRVGTWGQYASAFRVQGGECTIHKLFTDNEAVTGPSRGLVYVIDGHLVMHGGITAWGPGHYEPLISNAGGGVDLDTLGATGGFNLCPAWVDIVRTPTAAKVFIRVKDFITDTAIRHRPPVISSTGVDLGEVVIERDGLGTPIATTVKNRSKCEAFQDSTTTTNATPVVICPMPLDQNSTYIIDVEVTARDQLTGDSFGVWKNSHTWTRKLTAPVDKGTNGPADPGAVNGSSTSAPPAGWTISQVATDYDKVGIQVTGDASLHLDWVVNASVTRIKGTSSFIDLTGFTVAGMTGIRALWDGDVGYGGGSWNDQSGIGNNLTLTGTSAVAAGLNGHQYIHVATGEKALKASFSKGSAGAITIAAVIRMGAQPYPAAMPSADGNLVYYSDGVFDGQILGLRAVHGWAIAAGDAINGLTSGTYDANAGWLIVVFTATAGGASYLYISGDRDIVVPVTGGAIADGKPFAFDGNTYGLDVAYGAVFDHVLSDSDQAKLVAFLKTRFAL